MDSAIQKSAKDQIRQLIEKYHQVINSNKLKGYTEEETKKDFIQPLFVALGWDVSSKQEVTAEEAQSSGRVDYGFYLDGRIKFYLEAKPLKADIQDEDYAKQAIRYSWNKGVDWAVLTDFESLKIFYCQDPTQSLFSKLVFEIRFDEYIDRFNQLWLLSKDSFKANELDLYAQKHGKKMQKILVGDQLYKHLNECRQMLIEKLGTWNGIKDQKLLDEGVQKLLDRLIFIRVAEDREIERPTLIPLLREWESNKNGKSLYESMIGKFRELDDIYNSNLFTEHPFERWNESPGVTEKVIETFQGKASYYEYDFKIMPADVLGAVYENYLGHHLTASRKGVVLDKDAKKRKEQGIYYTPVFIVDYIVKNALKPVLDKCQSVNDLKKIKVLDPACGSGSFLIKALELINEKYKEFNYKGDEMTKIMILQENLFGVDLDEQAVEIARLNLLINSLEKRMKLPKLDKNIKNGNSLISGSDEELKKYFGDNFKDKKPFNWEEEFPEVFKQGGFDVIIGNPPYIQLSMEENISEELKQYFLNKYHSSMGRLNTFGFFINQGIQLLKDSGYLGFIIPNTILTQDYYESLRKLILETCVIENIVSFNDLPFKDAIVENVVLIIKKSNIEKTRDISNVLIYKVNKELSFIRDKTINQKKFNQSHKYSFNINIDEGNLLLKKKIEEGSLPLSKFLNINQAIALKHERGKWVSKTKVDENYKPLLIGGKNINRYLITWDRHYLHYNTVGIHSGGDEEKFLAKEKIFFRRVSDRLIGALDTNQFYGLHTLVVMTLRGETSLDIRFFLALFNSKLLDFYYKSVFASTKRVFSEIGARQVAQLPIKLVDFSSSEEKSKYDSLVRLVNKITDLNMETQKLSENSNKWNEFNSEIEKVDRKIDEEVYKLYGFTLEEIAIVEKIN